MLTIECDDDGGCYRLLDDGIGLCVSKSRNVLVRVRDALNAVRETGLVGLTVACGADTGVVLALCSGPPQLVVRRANGQLHTWLVVDCCVVEPARPDKDTPSNEPGIGVYAACDLLHRWTEASTGYGVTPERVERVMQLKTETANFLKARADAEPVP
jgi:hypothetical protein